MEGMDVLIVEDERLISLLLANFMRDLGHRVLACVPSGEDALDFVKNSKPDFILFDIRLEGKLDGIETAELISSEMEVPFAFATAYADPETRARAESTHPLEILRKPVRKEQIGALLSRVKDGRSA